MISSKENSFNIYGALHHLLLITCLVSLGAFAYGQKTRAFDGTRTVLSTEPAAVQLTIQAEANTPTPTMIFDGQNTTCANLDPLNAKFPSVNSTTHQFKYGESDSNYNFPSHSFPYTPASYTVAGFGPVVLDAPKATGRITFGASEDATNKTLLSWSSDYGIAAIILKVGNDSYAYDTSTPGFPFVSFSGGPINIMTTNGFSHIIFCYTDTLRTTAADVSVSGRVLTAGGRAVSGARVTILNAGTGQMLYAMTNPFGYYTVEGLDSDSFYVATIAKKGVKFAEDTKSFSLNDNIADLDFVANP